MTDEARPVVSHKIMPHVRENRFYNHEHEYAKGFLGHTMYMFFKNRFLQDAVCPIKTAQWVDKQPVLTQHTDVTPRVTWIGHSTFLIQCGGINMLTDPIFGNASFLYRRMTPAGMLPHELPPIDVVLLSHNHRDHMDAKSLMAIKNNNNNMHVLVPRGDKAWFDRRGFARVQECTWWERVVLPIERAQRDLTLTFLPAIHWSQRGFFDKNRSLWGSWMIEISGMRSYFAGDTSYSPHFSAIAREFDAIDSVFMPIGPCEPRAWMEHAHLSAQQAGQAFLDLKARHFIPMHWGTFPFGVDRFSTPIDYIMAWWRTNEQLLAQKTLNLLKIGSPVFIP